MRKHYFIFISILTLLFFTFSCDLLMKTEKKDGKDKSHHSSHNNNSNNVYVVADVTNLQVEKTYNNGEIRCDGQIKLSWNEPTDTSYSKFSRVEITSNPPIKGISNPYVVYKGNDVVYFNNIVNGVNYTFTVNAIYYSGIETLKSTGVSANIIGEDLIIPKIDTSVLWTSSRNNQVIIYNVSSINRDAYQAEITFIPVVNGINQPLLFDIDFANWTPFIISGLTNETEYTFSIKVLDPSGNKSEPAYNITTRPSAPPSEVGNLIATAGNGKVILTWDDPPEGDYDYIFINVFYTGNTSPINSLHSIVYEGIETKEINGLTNNYSYDFKISTVDDYGSYSTGKTISCTPTP